MKVITLYFVLTIGIFASQLKDGNYSVVENVLIGKKWRTKVELNIKDNEVQWVDIDMITKDGKLMSQDEKALQMILEYTDGINPYVELPREYMKKIKEVDDYNMSQVDTIVGATVISKKFNKMTLFLLKKSEKGKTGEFEGWFH